MAVSTPLLMYPGLPDDAHESLSHQQDSQRQILIEVSSLSFSLLSYSSFCQRQSLFLSHTGVTRNQTALLHSIPHDHHWPSYVRQICFIHVNHGIKEKGISWWFTSYWALPISPGIQSSLASPWAWMPSLLKPMEPSNGLSSAKPYNVPLLLFSLLASPSHSCG